MNRAMLGWGASFLLLAAVVAKVPGALPAGEGPRLAMVTVLALLGLVLLGSALAGPWMLRRSAKAEGIAKCPVGERCACGAWNFRPKRRCSCGKATAWAADA